MTKTAIACAVLAGLAVLAIVVIGAIYHRRSIVASHFQLEPDLDIGNITPDFILSDDPQSKGVNQALSTLFSSEDVDPLVTGQLYNYRNNTRDVYTGRVATGSEYGLQQFSSSGSPGDVGVDIGPDSLVEYAGSVGKFDDGIPEAWAFPSTPFRWYRPKKKEDFYGENGPELYDPQTTYPLYVQDNDPLIGEDTSPP
jgi:hypothetical protein